MVISSVTLRKKILADQYNMLVFGKGRGKNVYLVGGYIRDTLRGLTSQDRDYVVEDDIKRFAKEIAKITGGTLVHFEKDHMVRVAFKDGLTLDFTKPAGTIKEDLSKRDFTINAIAWSLDIGIYDPFNGIQDLKKKRIHCISPENLRVDPLRMLRAYRFAAELNGTIEKRTRESIKNLYKLIRKVSPERITLELFHLLNSQHPSKYLSLAHSDKLLSCILLIYGNLLENNIKAISRLERLFTTIPEKVKIKLKTIFSQNLTYRGLLFLELLLKHGKIEPFDIPTLRMSNSIVKRIIITHKGLKDFKEDNLFDLFFKSGEVSQDILLLLSMPELLRKYERFNTIWKTGLLSSEEVSRITGIPPGPMFGSVILKLKNAQFHGLIKNKLQAERLLSFFT